MLPRPFTDSRRLPFCKLFARSKEVVLENRFFNCSVSRETSKKQNTAPKRLDNIILAR